MHCLECGEECDGGYCRNCGIQWESTEDDFVFGDDY